MVVFSPLAGLLADKYESSLMFRRTKLAELLIMAFAAGGFLLNSGLWLVVALFAMATQSAFFSPARLAVMPKYFGTEELIRANAYFNAGLFVSILVGLLLGGLFIAAPGGGRVVAGVLLAASFVGWLAARLAPRTATADAPALKIDWRVPPETVRILTAAFSAPGVARPMLGLAFFYLVSTHITVLTPLYARDALGAGGTVANAMMGLFAVGAGAGALCAALASKRRSGFRLSGAGLGAGAAATSTVVLLTGAAAKGQAPTIAAFFETPAGLGLAASLLLSALCMSLFIVPLQAAIQRRAPEETRARIMAASNMLNALAAIAGAVAALLVTETPLTTTHAFLFVAILQALVALYMLRRRLTAPAGLYDEAVFRAEDAGFSGKTS
ncbi:MAG: MFS transporter, partial [Amphiplicatus sp.]